MSKRERPNGDWCDTIMLYVMVPFILATSYCDRADLSDRIAALEQHHAPPDEEPAR